MTRREASSLTGKLRTFHVVLDSTHDTHDGWLIYEVRGRRDGSSYTIWLPAGGEDPPDEFSVEGRLRIIRHPPCKLHDGFTEYRIIARR